MIAFERFSNIFTENEAKKEQKISIFSVHINGIVTPKMKMLSSFTRPSCRYKPCMSFFLMFEHKEEILKKQKVVGLLDFHSRERNIMEVSGDHQLFD